MPVIKQRMPWTSQPQVPAMIDWSNPIALKMCAAAMPYGGTVVEFSKTKSVDRFGIPSGTSIRNIVGSSGVGVGSTTENTHSLRLSATSNLATSAWEEPVSAATFMVVAVRFGNNVNGNAPIFGNQSPTVAPYSPWAIVDRSGTGGFGVECSAGGSVRTFDVASGLFPNNVPMVLVGRYNGSALESFKNGVKQSGYTACSGNITYPNSSDRGPAIGNFYNYSAGSRAFLGVVYLAVLWPVALSDGEISEISKNPWQIFSP